MAATRAQMAKLIAQELQILASGESLTAADSEEILTRLDAKRAWLIEEGLCYWAAETVPDAAKMALAKIVAEDCKTLFGVKYEQAALGYEELQRHVANRTITVRTSTDFY